MTLSKHTVGAIERNQTEVGNFSNPKDDLQSIIVDGGWADVIQVQDLA